jgi:hypothetical protein
VSSEVDNAVWDAVASFNALRMERHTTGEAKYGHNTFLGNDVIRMMLEEMADMANYIEYQAAKLMLLQQQLEKDPRLIALADGQQQITIGIEAFKGTGAGWGS